MAQHYEKWQKILESTSCLGDVIEPEDTIRRGALRKCRTYGGRRRQTHSQVFHISADGKETLCDEEVFVEWMSPLQFAGECFCDHCKAKYNLMRLCKSAWRTYMIIRKQPTV